jgi:hypothetical protein
MVESKQIEQVRDRIHRQRERLLEPDIATVDPVTGEARAFQPVERSHERGSFLAPVIRAVGRHPAIAVGVGAAVVLAGPRRSMRLVKSGLRAAAMVATVYRVATAMRGHSNDSPRDSSGSMRRQSPYF